MNPAEKAFPTGTSLKKRRSQSTPAISSCRPGWKWCSFLCDFQCCQGQAHLISSKVKLMMPTVQTSHLFKATSFTCSTWSALSSPLSSTSGSSSIETKLKVWSNPTSSSSCCLPLPSTASSGWTSTCRCSEGRRTRLGRSSPPQLLGKYLRCWESPQTALLASWLLLSFAWCASAPLPAANMKVLMLRT